MNVACRAASNQPVSEIREDECSDPNPVERRATDRFSDEKHRINAG